jgi:arylsulfatase A-like enzyme
MKDDTSVLCAADLFPSFCAIAGAKMPSGFAFDGKDKSKVFTGKQSTENRTLFWEYGRNNTSFAYPAGKDKSPNLAIRQGYWKLLMNVDGTGIQLYDLSADRNETTNVAAGNQQLVSQLSTKLLTWRKSLPTLKNQ